MVERYTPKKPLPQDEPEVAEAKAHKRAGRKTLYDPKYARIAQQLCSHGATDADLADAFGVSTVTIYHWGCKHEDFKAAIAYGKAVVFDPKVERALAQRAIGYSVDTEEVKITKDGDVIRYQVRKHYPPDPTCCIFWLKNRQPQQWRDEYRHLHDGKVELDKLTSKELMEQIKAEATALGLLPEALEQAAPKTNGAGTKH